MTIATEPATEGKVRMTEAMEVQLVKGLSHVHAIEEQSIRLLAAATEFAGDEETAELYRELLVQAEGRAVIVADRLEAYGARPADARERDPGLIDVVQPAPDTPIRLAETAFALESHEAAAYRMLRGLAERAGDERTAVVADRILEQVEEALALVAESFDRALDVALYDGGG
jgi:ferritin-like metal-binding protein YciE